jgi:hypothetical protein
MYYQDINQKIGDNVCLVNLPTPQLHKCYISDKIIWDFYSIEDFLCK